MHGLLYAIDAEDIAALDRCEGRAFAYERVERIVIDEESRRRRVHLYLQPEEGFEPWESAPDYARTPAWASTGGGWLPPRGWRHEARRDQTWGQHAGIRHS